MDWDELKKAFSRLVESVMSRVDFYAFYPCKVVGQNADGTLELKPEVAKLPGYSNVKIRYTTPAMRVILSGGDFSTCRALIGFEAGDPQKPYVVSFFGDSIQRLEVGDAGSAAYEFVALSEKVLTELNKIKTAFDAHTHLVAVANATPAAPGPVVGTAAPPAAPIPIILSVAATRLKTH